MLESKGVIPGGSEGLVGALVASGGAAFSGIARFRVFLFVDAVGSVC